MLRLRACLLPGAAQVLLEAGGLPLGGAAADPTSTVGPTGGRAVSTVALVAATLARYRPMYLRAKEAYEAKLWNGKYFNYDSSGSYQVRGNCRFAPAPLPGMPPSV